MHIIQMHDVVQSKHFSQLSEHIIIKGETLYANDEYVHPSLCLGTVSLERFNIFEIRFRYSTYGVICRFKFVF
jgi:hypothetical protein